MKLIHLCFFAIVLFALNTNLIAQERSKATKSDPNVPLFEVKNDAGQTVFAVYPGGVHIFVDDTPLKAAGGGFSVGRLSTGKAGIGDILTVSPNNVNIIIDDGTTGKAAGGGFSVGRLSTGKAAGDLVNYLKVTPDSTRIYVEETSTKGFAVGKLGATDVADFLYLTPDNYFIGHESGKNTTGLYNLFLGYHAGLNNTTGHHNFFAGYEAGLSNTNGASNVFIGNSTCMSNTGASQNVVIGNSCASDVTSTITKSIIMGDNALTSMVQSIPVYSSLFMGDNAGADLGEGSTSVNNCIFLGTNAGAGVKNTEYSEIGSIVAVGNGSGSGANGYRNVFIGHYAGQDFVGHQNTMMGFLVGTQGSSGTYNVYIGDQAGRVAIGDNNTYIGRTAGCRVTGSNNVFLGYNAGSPAYPATRTESNRLRIGENSLIYGEFDTQLLTFNGNVGVNRSPYGTVSLTVSPNNLSYGIYVDGGSTLYAAYFNGNVHATGTLTSSDLRFKKNIEKISSSLEKVTKLKGVEFEWNLDKFPLKGFEKGKQIGLIAQDVEKLFPELVREDENGYKAVAYDKLTAVLIEAVKEQQKEIETLQVQNGKIVELEAENKMLKEKLSKVDVLENEIEQLKKLTNKLLQKESDNN